jgi:L-2-hydroxyglutarate oxidase LhgO
MSEITPVDIVIIGAGVVGAAVALKISEKFPNQDIVILESGPRPAEGVTSRNSGVIHAGIYYSPQSLKAKTCVRGNALIYEWAEKHGVPFKKCGKYIIAKDQRQIEVLEGIYSNAIASGARDIHRINKAEISKLDFILEAEAAIWSPLTGIIDPAALTLSFLSKAEQNGVILMCNHSVTGFEGAANGNSLIQTSKGIIEARLVINAAGLYADEISNLAGVKKYRIYPCRGDYFRMNTSTKFHSLIYPVKEPSASGLGVHLTLDMDGRCKLGPDVEYVESKNDFRSAEHKLEAFKEAAQKLFGPSIKYELEYDTCGIRPKLRSPTEKEEKDFVISKDRSGLINLVGIESPGLTASLAIAEEVLKIL